jgi:uncharacterized protein
MKRSLVAIVAALISGVVFGVGLSVARMTDPAKIKDFLDIAAIPTGGWDPSLIFVMGAAVLVGLIGLRADRLLRAPLAAPSFHRIHRMKIDTQLVVGSSIFGVGWGLSGFCPGPAVVDLGIVPGSVLLFVLAMLAGSWLAGQVMEWSAPRSEPAPETPAA